MAAVKMKRPYQHLLQNIEIITNLDQNKAKLFYVFFCTTCNFHKHGMGAGRGHISCWLPDVLLVRGDERATGLSCPTKALTRLGSAVVNKQSAAAVRLYRFTPCWWPDLFAGDASRSRCPEVTSYWFK